MGFWKTLFGGSEETPEQIEERQKENDFDVLRTDGQRANRMGQYEYAIRCYRKALEIKDDLEVRDYLAHALIHNNEMESAIAELKILQQAEPENLQIALLMTHVYYMMEDYQAMLPVLAVFTDEMDVSESKEMVYYWRAKAYLGLEDNESVIEMLNKSIEEKSDFWDAYLLRGQTFLKDGKVEDAEKDANLLIEEVGEQEETLLMKARIEVKKGEDESALGNYNKVIEVNPFSIDGFRERAMLKRKLGDEKGADEDLEALGSINKVEVEENIEEKINQQYKSIDPYGIFG